MPAIEIESQEQSRKVWEVLIRVGGTFQGVGGEKRYFLVTQAQFDALVAAGVVKPEDAKDRIGGPKKKKA
jgi:hypothetical protein